MLLIGLPPHGQTVAAGRRRRWSTTTWRSSAASATRRAAWRDVVTLLNAGPDQARVPGHAPVRAGGLGGTRSPRCAARTAPRQGAARDRAARPPEPGRGKPPRARTAPRKARTDDLHQREPARPGRRDRRVGARRRARRWPRPRSSRATAAARAGATRPAAARAKALGDAAAALEQRAAEVTALVVREVGKPVTEARGEVARGVAILRYYAQAALLPDGETMPGRRPDQLLMARHRAGRRRRPAHAVELPGRDPAVEGRAEPGLRQRHDPEAVQRGGGDRAAAARDHLAASCPATCSRWCWAARRPRAPLIDNPGVAAVSFTGSSRGRPGDQPRGRPRAAAGCRPRWAARTRRSCWPTPTWTGRRRPSRTRRWATRARSARPPAG